MCCRCKHRPLRMPPSCLAQGYKNHPHEHGAEAAAEAWSRKSGAGPGAGPTVGVRGELLSDHPSFQQICFVGGPGTGKSTLAQALNVRLKLAGYDSEFCAEFARTYLRRSGPVASVFEQFVILAGASAREDELSIHQFSVSDSAAFLGEVYYQYERLLASRRGEAGDQTKLEQGLHELRRMCRKRLLKADHIFFVPGGLFDMASDPTRQYVGDQELLSRKIRAWLDSNDASYHVVEQHELEDRLDEVIGVLVARGAFEDSGAALHAARSPARPA